MTLRQSTFLQSTNTDRRPRGPPAHPQAPGALGARGEPAGPARASVSLACEYRCPAQLPPSARHRVANRARHGCGRAHASRDSPASQRAETTPLAAAGIAYREAKCRSYGSRQPGQGRDRHDYGRGPGLNFLSLPSGRGRLRTIARHLSMSVVSRCPHVRGSYCGLHQTRVWPTFFHSNSSGMVS